MAKNISTGKIEKKKHRSIGGILFDVFFYTTILVIFILCIFTYQSQSKGEVVSILGFGIGLIQTGSMIDGGFDIGDKVIVTKVATDTIQKDDILVFYKFEDKFDVTLAKIDITSSVKEYQEPTLTPEQEQYLENNRKTRQDAVDDKSLMIFHRVIAVWVDEYGTRYFETKGDSNATADTIYVREDLVIGKYQNLPVLTAIVSFISSPWGIVCVAIIPIIYLGAMEVLNIIRSVKGYKTRKALLNREISFTDEKLEKYDVNLYLEEADKIYIYFKAVSDQKTQAAFFLWGDLDCADYDAYQREQAEKIKKSMEILSVDGDAAYWEFWCAQQDTKQGKEHIEIYRKIAELTAQKPIDFDDAFKALKSGKLIDGADEKKTFL